MPPKQQRDAEATRGALLQAAEQVFLEKGFGNTSLSEIAKRAGITKSLIHHYFGTKRELWREVKTVRFMQYAERQMAMLRDAQPSVELLRASLAFYFDFLRRNPQIVRILAWMSVEQDEEACLEADRELIAQGTAMIREAQTAGRLRSDVDPGFILFVFIGLCQHWFQDRGHFCMSFPQEREPENLEDAYLDAIIKIFFEGILPRQG